jgi:hypothetical protein
MKNIKILQLIFIATLLFVGCNEEESVALIEPNHRAVVTSEMNFENTINPGGHIDFGDISRGVKSRTWTFPEGSIATIAGEEGNTSSKDVVKGIFHQPGVYNVVLSQIFKGNVYPNEDSTEPIQGVALDTTIVVTVLGNISSTLKAHYINDDGSTGAELTLSDNAENEIIASKYVRLSYVSEGSPQNITWNLDGGKPAQILNPAGDIDVRYSKLGVHNLQFIAARSRPFDADTVNVKNFIKVIPSTEPVTLDRVFEKTYQTAIGLEFSREMDPATINKNNFSIKIETAGGAVLTPSIKTITVDPNEGNVLIVTLNNEVIYNDDKVKVSYTLGALSTMDAVQATTITDALLTTSGFIKTNLLYSTSVDHSFENSAASNWPYLWWGGRWGEYDLSVSLTFAHTGSRSAYIEFRPNGGMIIGHRNDGGTNLTFPAETGFKYEMGAWIYVEDLGNLTGEANVRMYWGPDTNWGIGDNVTFNNSTPVGQWIYRSAVVQFSATGEKNFLIRGINTNTARLKFYMDDLAVYKLTARP